MNFVDRSFFPNSSKTQAIAKSARKKFTLLKTVYQIEKTSVNELMKKLDLSFPTLNTLIVDLVKQNLLIQHERGESVGGRKPNLYQLNNNLFKVLTIELDKFGCFLTIVDNNGNLLNKTKRHSLQLSRDLSQLNQFYDTIRTYVEEESIAWDDISGISISMPGLIDKVTGDNYTYFYEPNFHLELEIEKVFHKKTRIINDSKIYSLTEQQLGKLRNRQDGLIIRLDWGISLGIITNGEVYMGKNGFSGEMGHISFVDDGELCYCGKRGCLETLVSGVALVKKAIHDIENGIPTLIANKFKNHDLQPIHIIQAALDGDQYAIQLISELGTILGKAISFFLQVFNPEAIVLVGQFAKASTLITTPILQQIQTYSMTRISSNCEIHVSNLSDTAIPTGLARYFVQRYFEDKLNLN